MAANKEAIAIVLDVGPSMNQAPAGEATALETAIDAITMILQRKMFSESKDEISLVLFGTADTDNPLADGESYENISVVRPMGVADFDLLQYVQNDIQPSNMSADFVDALVVGLDHIINAIQGKRGFAYKRLILMSDLGGEFGDDQIDTITAGIRNSGTELNVIGPDFDDEDDEEKPGTSMNNHGKEKTAQQRAGETLVKSILNDVEGECYSFSEALPVLSYFQSRQVRPTAWKCQMEIGSMKIPVCGYVKVKDFKLKQSWKKVYAKDHDMEVGNLRTFHLNDEEETEIEREDMVEGHRYGNTLVPMSEDDKENMKYRTEKCFKVLGFTAEENIKRHHIMGDGVICFVAEKGDDAAAVAMSALIHGAYETGSVAIVRRCYNNNSPPQIGCLIPHIKSDYECFYWFELPFMEDVRQFTFGSLPVKESTTANKKYEPTREQLSLIRSLIEEMDLSRALEEDDEKCEALKPKLTFNPYFQRVYQCLQHRALNPDDPILKFPLIKLYLQRPKEFDDCQDHFEKGKKLFKLEIVKKKEDKQEKQCSTENYLINMSTLTPTMYFILENVRICELLKMMTTAFFFIIMRKFFHVSLYFLWKSIECLKWLREQSIKKSEPNLFNSFIKKFKETLIAKGRRDFWDRIVTEKQALITKLESEDSAVTVDEAEKFVAGDEKMETEKEPEQDESAEDLLGQLE
ncbi:hypothetical protein ScPMuIL_007507 [Solemya velum]